MRTCDGYDAWDSYERAGDSMGENVHNGNEDIVLAFSGDPGLLSCTNNTPSSLALSATDCGAA